MTTGNESPGVFAAGVATRGPDLPEVVGELHSSPFIRRHPANPLLTSKQAPYRSTLTYNAGVTKFQGKYVMVFRNDFYRTPGVLKREGSNMGLALSKDGITWEVQPKPCFAMRDEDIQWAYDPRLTVIEDRCYLCFAVDTGHGIRGGIAVTDDFDRWEILDICTPENRNMVLFPERISGKYVRLERPFPVYGRGNKDRFDLWYSDSPDLSYWGNAQLVLGVEDVPFANNKIGPAAPPVKTKAGWLTTFHAVDMDASRGKNGWETAWKKRYTAGIMLLDLANPAKVVGLCKTPLLVPEAPYEISGGIRNNVIFTGGMVLEDSGEVKIYYGAADSVECLATIELADLLRMCEGKDLPRHDPWFAKGRIVRASTMEFYG